MESLSHISVSSNKVDALADRMSDDPNISKVSEDFEALFVSMMLKTMRESMSQEMFAGDGSDTFGGLFDSLMGQHIAEHGGLGLMKSFRNDQLIDGSSITAETKSEAIVTGSMQDPLKAYASGIATENEPMTKRSLQPLLAHFDAQEAAMLALKSLLHDIGMCTENENSRNLMHRIQAATDLMQRLDHDCRLLVEQLADAFQCPKSTISIRYLIGVLQDSDPTTAEALRSCRNRLLSLRWQVSRIAASSSWIISEQRRIRHAIFEQASGLTDSNRYDASGRTTVSPDSLRIGTRS